METVKDIVIDLKNCEVYIGNNYFLLAPHSVVEKELSCELKPCPIVATRNLDFDGNTYTVCLEHWQIHNNALQQE